MSKNKQCIFCDIIAGRSPDTLIEFQNENIVIFKDIKPASDFHYLAVPRHHFENARTLNVNQKDLSVWNWFKNSAQNSFLTSVAVLAVVEMQERLKELLHSKGVNLDDVSYGFHWPPFVSVSHLHMHAIAPMSKMGFIARQVFKPINMWYCSVSRLWPFPIKLRPNLYSRFQFQPDYVISKLQPVDEC